MTHSGLRAAIFAVTHNAALGRLWPTGDLHETALLHRTPRRPVAAPGGNITGFTNYEFTDSEVEQ
jgi:hypothetical protein